MCVANNEELLHMNIPEYCRRFTGVQGRGVHKVGVQIATLGQRFEKKKLE